MKDYSKTGPTPGLGLDAPSYTWVIGDIDGDGRDEFAILHPRLPSLVTVSMFSYADVGLPAPASGGGQLVGTSYVAGPVVGGWQLSPSDQLTIADVDGGGTDEIVIYQAASGYIGVKDLTKGLFNKFAVDPTDSTAGSMDGMALHSSMARSSRGVRPPDARRSGVLLNALWVIPGTPHPNP